MSQTAPDSGNKANASVGRLKLIALISIYAAPLVAAWLWFGYVQNNELAGVSVNGELIHPAVPLTEFELVDGNGRSWQRGQFEKKWSMVYFMDGTCARQCEQTLYNMRQVRLSTGRRMERVQRVLVTEDVMVMAGKLSDASEGLAVVGGSNEAIEQLKTQMHKAEAGMPDCTHCIYLVDPFANVMMRFPPELDPKKMYKDIKHLLQTSRIG